MLTRLRAKNFKAWGEQLWEPGVELGPITLLLGPNSAGKTSLIQLPLLLKQTFEGADRALELNLGGQPSDLVDLGSPEALVHEHELERELGLGLSVRTATGAPEAPDLDYAATYRLGLGEAPALQRLELGRGARRCVAVRQPAGGFVLEDPGGAQRPLMSAQLERSLVIAHEPAAGLDPLASELVDASNDLRRALGALAYLGPLRAPPERSYAWSGLAPTSVGNRGEHAAQALLASEGVSALVEPGEEAARGWLLARVSAWLRRLGLADELLLARQADPSRRELVILRGGRRSNLVDVGSGVAQVLPVLVLAHLVPRGATILAEQPEIHLHPRAQVGLAELMAELAATRGVQFIVETHSELLFRRLQSLMADEALDADDCKLHFVDRDAHDRTRLTQLEVDRYGRVANWPRSFFGDALGETERQTRKLLERVARERGGAGR